MHAVALQPDHLHTELIKRMLGALRQNTFLDNFDPTTAPDKDRDWNRVFNTRERAAYLDWYYARREPLYKAYAALADEMSRDLFFHLLLYRLAGHLCVRIPAAQARHADRKAALDAAQTATPSTLSASGMFGTLNHYDYEFEGHRYRIDCVGLEYYLAYRQYFLERGDIRVRPEPGDHVIDGGACLGDTALVFSNAVGPAGRVYAFDPVEDNLEVLRFNVAQFPIGNVEIFPCGLSGTNISGPPIRLGRYSPDFRAGTEVPVRTIDDLVLATGDIPRVDYIKLDVEGSELAALAGARATILRHRPKMAISLYHKPDDLHALVNHVRAEFDFYDLHIDHYSIHMGETVLYCRPR